MTMTMERFAEMVHEKLPVPVDVPVTGKWEFAVVGTGPATKVTLNDMEAGPLPMYQAKMLSGRPDVDITGITRRLNAARRGSEKDLDGLIRQVNALNGAIASTNKFNDGGVIARTYVDDRGVINVGGLVTRQYCPVSHRELADLMVSSPAFRGAEVEKLKVDPGRVEAVVLVEGARWEVDGGIKAGMKIRNGQFGDCAYGFVGMLFRLLCKNGMMDVIEGAAVSRRHVGDPMDLAADVVTVLGRADEMFERARQAMSVELDAVAGLIELHRRGYLSRGALRKSIARIDETFDGIGVYAPRTSLWGMSQAITSAARDYSFSQMDSMGRLAGELVFRGYDDVLAARPLPRNAPSFDEVYEEFVA